MKKEEEEEIIRNLLQNGDLETAKKCFQKTLHNRLRANRYHSLNSVLQKEYDYALKHNCATMEKWAKAQQAKLILEFLKMW